MTRLSEIQKTESITAIIYGASGSGKTMLAGSLGSDTLIVTPSSGFATLQSQLFRKLYPNSNPYIELNDEDPVPQNAYGFDKIYTIIEKYLDDKIPLKNIVLEDATSVRRMALNKGLELNQKLGLSKTKEKVTQLKNEVVVPTIQDYSIEMNLVNSMVLQLCSESKRLGINFVMTGHERFNHGKADTLGGIQPILSIRPGFTGSTFPDEVSGIFDLTWHTETKGAGADSTYYQIRTAGDSVISAKTRYGGLFPTLIEKHYSLEYLFSLISSSTPLPRK